MSARGDWARPPAVAGLFYPADAGALRAAVEQCLATPGAPDVVDDRPPPKAVIAPHAGYVYSGLTAGYAYRQLARRRDHVRRVVLAGPAHRVPLDGVGVSSAAAFATPLGPVPVDAELRDAALRVPGVAIDDEAHAPEHSLEVHLPFLQVVLDDFTLLPLVVGHNGEPVLADVLEHVWGGAETAVVVSTDLSHYLDHATATQLDRRTAEAVVAKRPDRLGRHDACGLIPLQGLLLVAERHGLDVELLDLRTSADTAGGSDRVVGYGAFALA